MQSDKPQKKVYQAPTVTVYGHIETVTLQMDAGDMNDKTGMLMFTINSPS